LNTPDESLTSVLIVSEHVLLRGSLAIAVSQEVGDILISEASDLEEALKQCKGRNPEIVLLHLGTPPSIGEQKLQQLIEMDPDISIIVLFDVIDDAMTKAALKAGAAGCLDRSIDVSHLVRGILAAANGELALSQGISRMMASMLGREPSDEAHGVLTTPTPRELNVLSLVSLGMTNRAIAKRLLLSESTVRAHVRSISQKLGSQNRVQAVARAMALGMIGPDLDVHTKN
jgi:DNA-binding NarL/FixJ family response regulator